MRARAHDSARGTNEGRLLRKRHACTPMGQVCARTRGEGHPSESYCIHLSLFFLYHVCIILVCTFIARFHRNFQFTEEAFFLFGDGRQRPPALRDRLCDGVYLHLRGRLVATCLSPRGLSTAARAVRQRIKATRKEAGGAGDGRGGQKDRQEGQEAHHARTRVFPCQP